MNSSRRSARRMSESASCAAALTATSRSSPASAAASAGSAPSRIATARASVLASGGSRESRSVTALATGGAEALVGVVRERLPSQSRDRLDAEGGGTNDGGRRISHQLSQELGML